MTTTTQSPRKFKFSTVNTTTPHAHPKTKWLEFRVNDITIGHAHSFLCNGRYNAGRIGRSFQWDHMGLERLLGPEQYNTHRGKFVSPPLNLVYGTGSTIPLKKVKEIFLSVAI
jgi:hypothetical protein